MELAPCPNCSGYIDDPGKWVLGRPHIQRGRRSGLIFFIGCCAFSQGSRSAYDTEAEAEAAWNRFRAAKSAANPRLAAILPQLDEEHRRSQRRFALAQDLPSHTNDGNSAPVG